MSDTVMRPDQVGSEHGALPTPRLPGQLGPSLVLVSSCFNLALCFINTRHWVTVGTAHIVAVQLTILAIALAAVHQEISRSLLSGVVGVGGMVLTLKVFNPDLDLKILFDLALVPVFLLLGRSYTIAQADCLVRRLLILVIGVGMLEMLFPDWFQSVFDIWDFYTNKGLISANTMNYSDTHLFISSERGEDNRNLLPWLFGSHRISSIFLEPVSMGNFPIICLAWLLSAGVTRGSSWLLALLATVLCVALPDSRFAALCSVLMVLVRLSPWHRSQLFAGCLPICAVIALLVYGGLSSLPGQRPDTIMEDNLPGRLLLSGKILAYWNWPEWLGITPSSLYVLDTGYAYTFNNLGVPAALLVWLMFVCTPLASPYASTMRGMIAIYFATSLCVGDSIFSIKTGALCWFLFGILQNPTKLES